MKKSFAIAAGHPKTTEAAACVLRDGGNAVDAAIAAYWTACVAEPCMGGAGAGGFALVSSEGATPVLFDFFGQTPLNLPNAGVDFRPVEVDFSDTRETYYIGSGSIAVPGAVAGMFAMWRRYGSRPMKVLAEPGIEAAREGVALDAFQAHDLYLLRDFVGDTPHGRRLFYREGLVKGEGEVIVLPAWADYLEYLARHDERAFYEDEPSRHLVNDHSGHLTPQDLSGYQVLEGPPHAVSFRGHRVFLNPPPSPGGMYLAVLLREMEEWPDERLAHDETFAKSWEELCARLHCAAGDPRSLHLVWEGLLPNGSGPPHKRGSTSHISILDGRGNAVSMTFSIGEGSGYFIPGTDIQMNNFLGEPALLPGGPFSWQPATRLGSMMAPILAGPVGERINLAMGTGGAARIPFVLAQVIRQLWGCQRALPDAIAAPRLHRDRDTLHLEPGWPDAVLAGPYTVPHNCWQGPSMFFGGVNAVHCRTDGLQAVGDFRRSGASQVGA